MKKTFRSFQIGTIILGVGSFLSFAGALASTVAWYAYSSNAQIAFNGTSVAKTEQLQVGLKTNVDFSQSELGQQIIEQYGLTEVLVGEEEQERYVFAAPGVGLDSTIIKYYLAQTPFAGVTLVPVSTQKYEIGGDFNLYTSPKSGDNILGSEAEASWYCKIPLAFRVIKNNADIYVKNQKIWLTDATCIADGEGNIFQAVRTHFNNGTSSFLLNPTENGNNRSTTVAGLLDLDADGYYDSDSLAYAVTGNEIIYGQCSLGEVTRQFNEEDTEIIDLNNTGNDEELTTFTAKHRGNNNIYSSYDGIILEKAEYYAMSDIMPSYDANGMLSGGIPITVTSNDDAAIADVTLTVYIEGWDHSVIDNQIGYGFDLGLTFEINRVE